MMHLFVEIVLQSILLGAVEQADWAKVISGQNAVERGGVQMHPLPIPKINTYILNT